VAGNVVVRDDVPVRRDDGAAAEYLGAPLSARVERRADDFDSNDGGVDCRERGVDLLAGCRLCRADRGRQQKRKEKNEPPHARIFCCQGWPGQAACPPRRRSSPIQLVERAFQFFELLPCLGELALGRQPLVIGKSGGGPGDKGLLVHVR
jgi:hypothetical protein